MPAEIIKQADVKMKSLPGRDMIMMITPETCSAEGLSMVIIEVDKGASVKPCHSHNAEEVVYILSGSGEVWVDGVISKFSTGDAIFFPFGSKHMLRNTGDKPIKAVCVFSPSTTPEKYTFHEESGFNG